MATRRADISSETNRVQQALAAAHEAAKAAVAECCRSIDTRSSESHGDPGGGAWVQIRKPSHSLRETLKALGETKKLHDGLWKVSDFSKHIKDGPLERNNWARNCANRAAAAVLTERFPAENEFMVHSWDD